MKLWPLAFFLTVVCASSPILALPAAPVVASGTAAIPTGPRPPVINQTGSSAVLNWQSFNIGSGQSAQFVQPSRGISVLNGVSGPAPIFGQLVPNGSVLLVNPAGISATSGGSKASGAAGTAKTPSTAPALAPAAAGFANGAVTIRMPLVDSTPISVR